MKGISRIDSKSTHGWYARVYRPILLNKLFSDRKHGGRENSLAAAQQWLVENTQRNLPQITPGYPYPFFRTIPANNTSGRLGVSVTYSRHGRGRKQGLEFLIFNVHYRAEGRAKTQSFYPTKEISKEGAFLKACQFRKEYENTYDTFSIRSKERIRRRYSAHLDAKSPLPAYNRTYSDEFMRKLRDKSARILVVPGSPSSSNFLQKEGFEPEQKYYWRDDVMNMLYTHDTLSFHEGQFAVTIWN